MSTLLRLDASARREGSKSRALGDHAEALWRACNPGGRVVTRDVSGHEIPPVSNETITGFYTAPDAMDDALLKATALSDKLIAELQAADCLLVTTPIYNFGVPAGLKAWIDQIVRIGHTFSYQEGHFEGLVRVRRAIVVCAYGAQGYGPGEPLEAADFLRPYLQFLFAFLGVREVDFVSAEATTGDAATVDASMAGATSALDRLLPAVAA